jgi:hypothetical protein
MIALGLRLFASKRKVVKKEGITQEEQTYLDEEEVGKCGTQGVNVTFAVKYESTLVIEESIVVFKLLVALALLAHHKVARQNNSICSVVLLAKIIP